MTDTSNRIRSFNSLAASKPLQKETRWWHSCPTLSFKWQNTQNARNELLLCWKEWRQQVPNPFHASAEGWSQPGIWAQGCCLQEFGRLLELPPTASWIIYLCGRNLHFLVSEDNTDWSVTTIKLLPEGRTAQMNTATLTPNQQPRDLQQDTSAARHFCSNEQQAGFGTSADATLNKDLASCQWRENRSKKINKILNKGLNTAIPNASKHCRKWK